MNKDELDLLFTNEIIKSEYVKSIKAIALAKARLKNARTRSNLIKKAMLELGYDMEVKDE